MVTFVGFFSRSKPCILAHCPKTRSIHAWMNSTGKRKFAGVAWFSLHIEIYQILFCGQIWYFNMRACKKMLFSLRSLFFRFAGRSIAPFIGAFTFLHLHANPPSVCQCIITYGRKLLCTHHYQHISLIYCLTFAYSDLLHLASNR